MYLIYEYLRLFCAYNFNWYKDIKCNKPKDGTDSQYKI